MTNLKVTHTRWMVIQCGFLVCTLVLITTFASALKADASDVIGGKCSTEGQTLPIGNLTARCSKTGNELKWLEVKDLSYEGCDIELDWQPTWRDCPRSFDAETPQQIRNKINEAGLSCVKPKSVGSDRNGGKFLQCMIGSQPITILSWPSNAGRVQFVYKSPSFVRDFLMPQGLKSQWAGCSYIWMQTPRYIIWIPAQNPNLEPNGELVRSLRKALGIPQFAKGESGKLDQMKKFWGMNYGASRFPGAVQACEP